MGGVVGGCLGCSCACSARVSSLQTPITALPPCALWVLQLLLLATPFQHLLETPPACSPLPLLNPPACSPAPPTPPLHTHCTFLPQGGRRDLGGGQGHRGQVERRHCVLQGPPAQVPRCPQQAYRPQVERRAWEALLAARVVSRAALRKRTLQMARHAPDACHP